LAEEKEQENQFEREVKEKKSFRQFEAKIWRNLEKNWQKLAKFGEIWRILSSE